MTGRPRIRPAEARDAAAIRALLRQAGLPLDGLDEASVSGFAVAEAAQGAIGAAGVETYGCHGLLRSVVVDPRERGRGLGERLVADRVAWAAAQGLDDLYLLTTTARDYFTPLGFAEVERAAVPDGIRASLEFVAVCPASARSMRLPLGARPEALRASNKAAIRRLLERVDRGDRSAIDECYAPDYVDHSSSPLRALHTGVEGLKKTFAMLFEAFPDTTHTIEDLIAEEDKVVARIRASGTHTGPLGGAAPTGRKVEMTSISIYRFAAGKIVERWSVHEGPGVLEQVGQRPEAPRRDDSTGDAS